MLFVTKIVSEGWKSICLQVWNPSFDVTPAALITGIITERGLVPKPAPEAFDVTGFMTSKGLLQQSGEQPKAVDHVSSIPGFYALDLSTVKDYLADRPALGARVGPAESKSGWQVSHQADSQLASFARLWCWHEIVWNQLCK